MRLAATSHLHQIAKSGNLNVHVFNDCLKIGTKTTPWPSATKYYLDTFPICRNSNLSLTGLFLENFKPDSFKILTILKFCLAF